MKRPRELMRILAAVAAALCLVLLVAACGDDDDSDSGSGSDNASGDSAPADGETVKLAGTLITSKNDGSFGESIYGGMEAALEDNPNLELTAVLENQTTNQQISNGIKQLAPLNQVVVTSGGSVTPSLDALAPQFLDTHFLQISGMTEQEHENVTGLITNWGAGAYVAGVLAATISEAGVVGFVGGQAIPDQAASIVGFEAGAKSVDPNVKVLTTETGDFNDVAQAKAATAAQLDSGADVIYPFLDAAVSGVYQAADESGTDPAIFKITIPNCDAYPNMVGTQIVDLTLATQRLIDAYMADKLEGGAIMLGLANPEVQRVELCPKYEQDKEVADTLEQTVADINSGKIELPEKALLPPPSYQFETQLPE
jgi:basic membrane protein A